MKTVTAVHTALPMVEITSTLFNEYLPNVRLINIVDDSLIQDIISAGKVPPAVARRLIGYFFAGVDAGADLIFKYIVLSPPQADGVSPDKGYHDVISDGSMLMTLFT